MDQGMNRMHQTQSKCCPQVMLTPKAHSTIHRWSTCPPRASTMARSLCGTMTTNHSERLNDGAFLLPVLLENIEQHVTMCQQWLQDGLNWHSRWSDCTELYSWNRQATHWIPCDGPLTRYAILRVAHAPGMPGTFYPPPRVSDPDMHHVTCVTHVPWCMPGSPTSGFLWSRWQGKRSRHSRCMRKPQVYSSGKSPWQIDLSSCWVEQQVIQQE